MQEIPFLDVLLRDALAGSTVLITFVLAMTARTLLKKSHGRLSTTTGLAVYFLTFLVYTVSADLTLLYRDQMEDIFLTGSLPEVIGGSIWVFGIIVFIYSTDRETMSGTRRPGRITLLTLLYCVCFLGLIAVGVAPYFVFFGLATGLVYVSWLYLKALLQLEMVRRRFPQFWFYLAFNLTGFGNFLILISYKYSSFLLKNICILAGVLILLRVWNELPNAEDLDWLLTLDRLIVIESKSSIPLMDFRFRISGKKAVAGTSALEEDGALVASAVGGIDRLMDEILADTDELGEIVHGKKTVMFLRRELFTCVLVADRSMEETRYRMESFALEFERRYREEVSSFSGDMADFSKAESLIRRVFI